MPSTRVRRLASSSVQQIPLGARHGLTAASLLVLIAIAAFAVGVMLPAIGNSRETANKIKCANNLKQLGIAIQLYANDNRGNYPRTKYEVADTLIPDVTNTGRESSDPFGANTTVPANCVPSAFFLLLRTEDITAAVFTCPSSGAQPDSFGGNNGNASQRSNFTDLKANLSYSYANPYPDTAAAQKGFKLTIAIDPGFAVASDLNPGVANGANVLAVTMSSSASQIRLANSHNHDQSGQNIAYADGHVEFDATPFAGLNQDNIYCRGKGGPDAPKTDIVNSPKDESDSVLLPTEQP